MMTTTSRPRAPAGLGPDGRRLWRDITSYCTLEPHEQRLVVEAARLADQLADLQAVVDRDGPMTTGSKGQPRVHPAVVELRQGRDALGRLLARVHWPDIDGVHARARSVQARHAASERWHRPAG